jgi:hypothetical protein
MKHKRLQNVQNLPIHIEMYALDINGIIIFYNRFVVLIFNTAIYVTQFFQKAVIGTIFCGHSSYAEEHF